MFIVAPLNVSLDGSNPTMLVGYGAHPPLPCSCWRAPALAWCKAGSPPAAHAARADQARCVFAPRQQFLVHPPMLSRRLRLLDYVCTFESSSWQGVLILGCMTYAYCYVVLHAEASRRLPEDHYAFVCREPHGFPARLRWRVCHRQHTVRTCCCWYQAIKLWVFVCPHEGLCVSGKDLCVVWCASLCAWLRVLIGMPYMHTRHTWTC